MDEQDAPAPRAAEPATIAHINPVTGLATDYLNHFNEAIMLLEMLPACPECRDDLRAWTPMSYCDHFRQSGFAGRDRAITAYENADPAARDMLDAVTETMTTLVEHARKAIDNEPNARLSANIAERTAAWLKLLAAQAGAVINGQRTIGADGTPQSAVDRMIG
ncbi:hypothetical protein DXH78_17065 [Undibacter mobilis]|uniref:Uncharacterized protein n=1 Tax=Undibacter mobilis TaxID=2292256 RepID=A0A371B435_9BRAD|nr:hypothetical protein DXH78_17065 [Undibacter mobilis]